jgi:DtxR family Mn-dependent transcriptional regulator
MSESIEMYLSSIIELREDKGTPVPLSQLAHDLAISSVSANEMCRRLQEQGFVVYKPYKGVTLTQAGEERARLVLRRRGLWTVFLAQKLDIEPCRARREACQLEHNTSDDVANRLDEFLGHPRITPLGKPIPPPVGDLSYPFTVSLKALPVGRIGHVSKIKSDAVTRDYLNSQGMRVGVFIKVVAVAKSGQRLLEFEDGSRLSLNADITKAIDIALMEDASKISD